jgi:hypothetical protein
MLSIACSRNKSNSKAQLNKHGIVTINIPKKKIRSRPFPLSGDYFYDVKYVPLETDTTCFLGKHSMFQIYKDEIIVSVTNPKTSIFRFNSDGKFLNSIGRKGRGPGEYSGNISRFDINNKHFFAHVDKKVMKYELEGQYVGSEKITSLEDFLIPRLARIGEAYYFCEGDNYLKHTNTKFELQRVKNKVVEKFFELPNELKSMQWGNIFSFSGDKIFYAPFANDTIYELSESKIIPRFYHHFRDKKFIGFLRYLRFYETNTHYGFIYSLNSQRSYYYYCKNSKNLIAGSKFDYSYTDNSEAIIAFSLQAVTVNILFAYCHRCI